MQEAQVHRAVAAAMSAAASNGLTVGDAIVLQNSNKVAVRLLPCDVMARVALGEDLQPELELAHRLADAGAPVAEPAPRVDPGVHQRDGFGITLWTFYESAPELPPAEYADALQRLHAVMRTIDVAAPRASDRVASARSLLADRDRTPELGSPRGSSSMGSCSSWSRSWATGTADSCCTASHTQETSSPPGTARSSSTSRRAAAGRSSSISLMFPTRSPSTTQVSIRSCCISAGCWRSRW